MDHMKCTPTAVVAELALRTDNDYAFYVNHRIKCIATGARNPWPNRAEAAVGLFKQRFHNSADDLGKEQRLKTHTFAQVCQVCVWASRTQHTTHGKTPTAIACGRRPPELVGAEAAVPAQLSHTAFNRIAAQLSHQQIGASSLPKSNTAHRFTPRRVSQRTTNGGTVYGRQSCVLTCLNTPTKSNVKGNCDKECFCGSDEQW